VGNSTFDPAHSDARKHAASGFVFTGIGQMTRVITQFLSVIFMARLLNPSDFGLVAKVTPIYLFAYLFHDLGLSQATIQKPEISNAQVNAFFWINSTLGATIALIIVAFSPLIGWFYHDRRAAILSIGMAFLIFIAGVGNQHGAIMQRRMVFRDQAIIVALGSISSLLASILWGFFFHNYWALFIGLAVGTIVPAIGVWTFEKWRPSVPEAVSGIANMLQYGLGITGGNLINFVVSNLNNVAMGRVFGDTLLGIYDRSARLLSMPIQQLTFPITTVILPILYRLHDNEDEYRATFLRAVASLTFAVAPGVLWVVVSSDAVITIFLGPKWIQAAPVFALLSFGSLPQLVNSCANWLIVTQGRSNDYARWGLFFGLLSVISLFIGLRFGIVGVAISASVVHLLSAPFYWWYACRHGPVSLSQVWTALVPLIVAAAITAPVLVGLRHYWPFASLVGLLISGSIVSYVVNLAIISIFPAGRSAIVKDFAFGRYVLRGLVKR
jgi:PST family polysaccharide transporter